MCIGKFLKLDSLRKGISERETVGTWSNEKAIKGPSLEDLEHLHKGLEEAYHEMICSARVGDMFFSALEKPKEKGVQEFLGVRLRVENELPDNIILLLNREGKIIKIIRLEGLG